MTCKLIKKSLVWELTATFTVVGNFVLGQLLSYFSSINYFFGRGAVNKIDLFGQDLINCCSAHFLPSGMDSSFSCLAFN